MEIVHRVALNVTAAQRREFAKLGLELASIEDWNPHSTTLAFGDLRESHPNWKRLRSLVSRLGSFTSGRTEFTPEEVASAQWFALGATDHVGYPAPNCDRFGYRAVTYDLTDACEACGAGRAQTAPFRMSRAPSWARRDVLQMNWVFDAFFVSPAVWKTVFAPFGIRRTRVLNSKGAQLKSVVQLDIPLGASVRPTGFERELCRTCRRKKYTPRWRGVGPSLVTHDGSALVRTLEVFGSGGRAFSLVIASRELVQNMREHALRGVTFTPLKRGRGRPQRFRRV